MSSYSLSPISLLRLHDLWRASLAGAPSAILPSQKSIMSTILAHPWPSALFDEDSNTLFNKVSTTLFINIALLYAFKGSLALASINFEEAIALTPHCAIAHFGLGLTRFLEARDAGAIQAWKDCMEAFETTAPEDTQACKKPGTNDIWYHQILRPYQYGENQRDGSQQGGLGYKANDNSTDCHGWILAKDAVEENIDVAQKRMHLSDKNSGLEKDRKMPLVKGIPAGLLFGPPPELRQKAHPQSNRVNEQLPKGPMKNSDIDSLRGYTDDNGMSSRSASALKVLQGASIPAQGCGSSKTCEDRPQPAASGLTLNIKNDDCGYLSIYHQRGQSSPAVVQLGSQAEGSENGDEDRVNAVAYQPAVKSTMGNSQPNILPSSHIKRHHEGHRTFEDLATFNTPAHRKPLPQIPSRHKDMSYQESPYALAPPPQQQPSTPPPTLSPSCTLSTKVSSLARLFTKAKRIRRGKENHSRTESDIDAGIDVDPHADTGSRAGEGGRSSSRLSSHSTSRGVVASRSKTPLDDDNRSKGKAPLPKRPPHPSQGLSAQSFQESHPPNLAFVKADTEPRYISVGLAKKLEWEKNMERKVDDEPKPPKPLFFPREEFNRKPEGKSGIGLGLGKVKTIPIPSSQNQDDMLPEPLSIPHSAPLATTGFVKGSISDDGGDKIINIIPRAERRRVLIFNDPSANGIDAAYSLARGNAKPRTRIPPPLHQYPSDPAVSVSVPAFPQRDNSLSPVELSASAPSYSPPQPIHPPPAQQRPPPPQCQQHLRRGRPLSQLSHEREWDDQKGDFVIRNDEGNGKGRGKVKRDESSNDSITTRRGRDQSSRPRQGELNELDTASITSTKTTKTNTTTPASEETRRPKRIQLPHHIPPNYQSSNTSTSTINLKKQNTDQSLTYPYPTLTTLSPLPISPPDFRAVFNLSKDDEGGEEEEEEATDGGSERSINMEDIIQNIDDFGVFGGGNENENDDDVDERGYYSTGPSGGVTPNTLIPGAGTVSTSRTQDFVGGGSGGGYYNNKNNNFNYNDGYYGRPLNFNTRTTSKEAEQQHEEEDDDARKAESREEENNKKKEDPQDSGGGGLLLSSATFQGFGGGIAGRWYDGKWH